MKRKSIGSAIRKLSLCCAPVVLLPVSSAFGQQIASADFTRAPEPAIPAQDQKKMTLPVGCERVLPGIIADGFVEPEGHKLPKIMLELTKLSNDTPTVGSELQAEVRLHNSGKQSVRIPWSTDIYKVTDGQGPDRIGWDGGSFQILLRGQQENDVLLKSLTYEFYGSTSSPGSLLTIQPGEWASAVIKFKLEANCPSFSAQDPRNHERMEMHRLGSQTLPDYNNGVVSQSKNCRGSPLDNQ
jgi:hypothetical protein